MRAAIRGEVAGIQPLDDREAQTQGNVIRWIDSGAELCRRKKPDIPPRHLIAYFVVVDDDYLLLVDHINAELWLPTGGHVGPGEHPRDTVRREAREELSLDADFMMECPLFLTETDTVGKTAGHTDVSLWYVLKGNRNDPVEHDRSEFHGVEWFHRDRVPLHRADPGMARFIRKLYGG